MTSRVKCPGCGRVQPVPDGDAETSLLCSACGLRFDLDPSLLRPADALTSSPNTTMPASNATARPSAIVELGSVIQATMTDRAVGPYKATSPVSTVISTPISTPASTQIPEPVVVPSVGSGMWWLIRNALLAVILLAVLAASTWLIVRNAYRPRPTPTLATSKSTKPSLPQNIRPRGASFAATSPFLTAPRTATAVPAVTTLPTVTAVATTSPDVASVPAPSTDRSNVLPRTGEELPSTQAAITSVTATNQRVPHPTTAPIATPDTSPIEASTVAATQKFHPRKADAAGTDLDDKIGVAITKGVDYLLSQFASGHLKNYSISSGETAGLDALAVYALLQAGEAEHDLRLGPNTPLVEQMLRSLKAMPMDHDHTTYSRALRAAALSVYHRQTDKQALRSDALFLMHSATNGHFSYDPTLSTQQITIRGRRFDVRWDNSNSQYGALGVWAAAEAGVEVPSSFWEQVDHHWTSTQLTDGQWPYSAFGDSGRQSMTVAGVTTLLVCEDHLDVRKVVTTLGHEPFSPGLQKGLGWLEADDNAVTLSNNWHSYGLFGVERAALASGFKYFGTHDWYRELADKQLLEQHPDGSWDGTESVVDTAYTLLFLSRGRHPIFMNKLRFDGFYANRPRDVANLCKYTADALERPLNWQVVNLKSDWSDWMDSPVLFIASHKAVEFSEDDRQKLRKYTENGGLIFTHADGDSPEFNTFVATLAKQLYPEYALKDLPPEHPVFSTLYKIKNPAPLQGVSNGSRLLLIHSPTDLNKAWQLRDWLQRPAQFQLGVNIFIYAAGKANLRNKLKTPIVPEPAALPTLNTTLAEIRYNGDWDPEPAAWPRFGRLFQTETGAKLRVKPVDPEKLDALTMPVAHLTGTRAARLTPDQSQHLHDYVQAGGILLVDACGGSPDFNQSMLLDVLPHAFPSPLPTPLKNDHPILAGTAEGMTPLTLHLRPYRAETDGATAAPLSSIPVGKGLVLYSNVDLTTALLGTNTWPVNGYDPEAAYALIRNTVLFALEK